MAAPSISTYILSNSSHYYGSEGGAAVMTSPSDSVTKVSAIISQTSGGAAIETVETTVKTSSDLYADRWALTWPTAGITASPYYVRMWATNSDGDGAVREVAPYIYFPPAVSVTSPANGSTLTDSSVTMAWTATDDYGISYQRASVSHDGTEMWGAEVEGTSIAVPSSVVFENGESYSFSVTARNGKGMESTATSTVDFSFIAPTAPALEITEGDGKSASITVTDSSYTESGTILEVSSSMMESLTIHGKSVQDGTPTPSAPVAIKSVQSGNLSPFFSKAFNDTSYWSSVNAAYTQLDDGWAHVVSDRTQSGYVHPYAEALRDFSIDPGAVYTLLVEVRNCTMTGTGSFVVTTGATYPWESNVTAVTRTGSYFYALSLTSKSSPNTSGLARFAVQTNSGKTECDVRLSIWKGAPSPSGYAPVGSILVHSVGENLADDSSGYHVGVTASNTVAIADAYRSVICQLPPSESSYEVTVSRATVEGQYFRICTTDAFPYAGQAVTTLYSGTTDLSKTVTVPASARWLIVVLDGSGATITSGNVKVQLGSTATAYEPYSSTTTPIPVTLRSLPDGTHDEWISGETEDTLVQRVGVVDLGTRTWTYNSGAKRFYNNFPASAIGGNLVCTAYPLDTSSNVSGMANKTIWNEKYAYTANNIVIHDEDYTDPALLKVALDGVTCLYKLATPVTTTLAHVTLPYVDGSAWVDAEVTPNIEATFRPVDFPDQPAADSVDVVRVNADGSTWTVASNLTMGDTVTDPLPPLGVDAVYKAVGKTSAGGMSEKLYMHGIPTTGWVLNFGDAAQETVGFIYNPQATMTLAQGGESYHFADGGMGGGFPVFYPTTDRDASGTLAFDTVLYGDSDRLLDLCRRYPVAWLRDPFGHRWRAHVRPSVSHGVGQVWPVTIAWDAVRFEEV